MVAEVADRLRPGGWMLVGGLMVHAHASLAGVPNTRPTDDADIVTQVAALSYADAVDAIAGLGFVPYESLDADAFAYRFTRGRERIDLMATDRVEPGPRFRRRPVLQVPGSDSATAHVESFTLSTGVVIRIPDVTAALSLKGAACGIPSANVVRHAQDGVVLLACAASRGARVPSKSERVNINRLIARLGDVAAWGMASPNVRRLAVLGLKDHFRPDWQAPSFVLPGSSRPDLKR